MEPVKKSKRKTTLFVLFLLLLVCGIAFGIAFQNDLLRPKMRHVHMPGFMHEAIHLHNNLGINHYVADVHFGPSSWPNAKDYGQKNNWSMEEKECFIVYYNKDKDAKWQLRAQSLLTELVQQKRLMQEKMKMFFMNPQRINNRKLAFYLPTSEAQYDSVVRKIAKSRVDSIYNYNDGRFGGFMYSEFGPLGFKPVGVVIKPSSFDVPLNEPGSYREVALNGLQYYENWAIADQALVMLEKIPWEEIALRGRAKLDELLVFFEGAGQIGNIMLKTMQGDSSYASLAKILVNSPKNVLPSASE